MYDDPCEWGVVEGMLSQLRDIGVVLSMLVRFVYECVGNV